MLLVRTNPVPASSRRGPGGSRRASTTSTAQLATISPAATSSQVSQRGIAAAVAPPVAQRAAGVRRRLGLVAALAGAPSPAGSGEGTGSRPSAPARNWPV